MTNFNRILVPTDFSNCSQEACETASTLALKFGSSIELLHVNEPPGWQGFVIPELVVSLPNEGSTSLDSFVETRTRRLLDQLVEKLQRAGVSQVRHRMESGEPSGIILRIANEEHFDLVVMGTHGRTGFERLVVGSVAERVVREASCPVLTVRGTSDAAEGETTGKPTSAGPS
jgi:nucleotide-binding universal stress UspA family protein